MTPYLVLSAAVFSIGAFGVLARRNLLIVLMSLELMLNGVNLALTGFSRIHGSAASGGAAAAPHGQVFVLMVMAVAAAEVAVGLALVIAIFRTRQTVDTADISLLKG
jgi:NADH-quinone oxidoreductase subunit K